jgi:hypothetical protein
VIALSLLLLTVVPFVYHDNRMVIQCRIGGQGPFSMILDTGAPDVTITPMVAKRLGLKGHDAGTVSGAGNHAVEGRSALLAQVSVGQIRLRNVKATILDLSQIQTKFRFSRLDGIIGYPLLERYITFVDVDAGVISFSATRPRIPSEATVTPMSFAGTIPVIAAGIDGIKTTVIVDTGDRSSLTLFGPFSNRYNFYNRYPSRKNLITGYGIGGPIYADVFSLPRVYIFKRRLSNVVTRASRQTGGAFISSDQGGSVGTGVLKRFNVVYDYGHKIVIAWPSKYFRTSDAFVAPF